MIFHSLDYILFLLAVLAAYWALPKRGQNILLLAASYFFYGYLHPWFLGLIALTSTMDWFAARQITAHRSRRSRYLALTLGTNLAILCSFKYLDFFTGGHALQLLHGLGFTHFTASDVKALLPVGISFYTFQSASYVVDVYRERITARKSLADYALFVSFFPQLVAGPIERAGSLLEQFERERVFDARIARGAVVLILFGYLKKLVIADNAALICNKVFLLDDPAWPILWAGVLAFSVQIFADFSAYSDIARGSARMFGFELMRNFDHPYLAASPGEFWRRWHISLSTWFRDYVYTPLGGNRHSPARTSFNILATFLISGLWHGASWNFVLWGGYHGLLLVLWRHWGKTPHPSRPSGPRLWLQVLLTFALVNIGWLIFRETNLSMLAKYLSINPLHATALDWQSAVYLTTQIVFLSLPLVIHACFDRWMRRHPTSAAQHYPGYRWALAQACIAVVCLIGIILLSSSTPTDFIYFQF